MLPEKEQRIKLLLVKGYIVHETECNLQLFNSMSISSKKGIFRTRIIETFQLNMLTGERSLLSLIR